MEEIKYNQNYDKYTTTISRNGKKIQRDIDYIPTDFETLLDYIKNNPSNNIEICDKYTIFLKISKKNSLIIKRTLSNHLCKVDFISGSFRSEDFLILSLNILYLIICQHK